MTTGVRRLTIVDGAILIAALAIGLGLLRLISTVADYGPFLAAIREWPPWEWPADRVTVRLSDLAGATFPVTAVTTLALLILRLIPPRPSLRRLACQPGFVACTAFLAVAGLSYGGALASLSLKAASRRFEIINLGPMLAIQHGGLAVAACWLMLAVGGRWRPEPSWIDRAGRTLGLSWIGVALIQADVMVSIFLSI